ncbi:TAXI family TRAP transporter solute-binding subunit [Camelimonas sp. ID_303_24]
MTDVRMLLAALLFCVAAISGVIYIAIQPTQLRVGVTADDAISRHVMQIADQAFRERKKEIRLKTVVLRNAAEVATALNAGSIDLGVARSDNIAVTAAEAVLVLRREALVIVARGVDDVTDVSALAGKRIGILAFGGPEPGNRLNALFDYYGLVGASQKSAVIQPADLAEALSSRRFDAFALLGSVTAPAVAASVRRIAEGNPGGIAIIDMAEAEALAQRVGDLETVSIPAGIFRGSPPLPAKKKDTVAAPVRMMARADLDEGKVSLLLQQFLSVRSAIRRAAPGYDHYEVPDPEDSPVLVHQGARAFRDGESTGLLERYSDVLYLGLFVIGGVASVATAIAARFALGRRRRLMQVLGELRDIGSSLATATSLPQLDQAEARVEHLLASVFERAANCELSADDLAAINLAFDWWRTQITDARARFSTTRTGGAGDRFQPAQASGS